MTPARRELLELIVDPDDAYARSPSEIEPLQLEAAGGHRVLATSGSSGKCSFLNHTTGDVEMKKRHFRYTVGWPFVRASADRTVFWLGPMKGPNSAIEPANFTAENWGRPGAVFALTDEPLR